MRLLHLADLHLDTPLLGRTSAIRAVLRTGLRAAFSAAVERAVAESVDAVVVAGDLFDGVNLTYRTERFLLSGLEELEAAGIPVFYATGNHDPGGPGGVASRIAWPGNVTLFAAPEPRRVAVERDGEVVGYVTGAGHDSARVARDLSQDFPRPQGELPEVALLHTQVAGASGSAAHDRYAPSELAHLRASGYDYWALGHIHLREQLSASPPVHYSGNLQGHNPRETGPKGGLLVEFGAGGVPAVRFLELAPVRWERIGLDDLVEVPTLHALGRRIVGAWQAGRSRDPGLSGAQWLLRVELSGPTPVARQLREEDDRRALEEELAEELGLEDVELRAERAYLPIQVADHRDRPDVLGEALRMAENPGPSPSELLGIGTADLAGWEDSGLALDEYIRELLEGAPREIVERMVRRDA